MITIVSSRQDPIFSYYNNLIFLRNELRNNAIHFQGLVNNHAPTFVYNAGRIYDFTRAAKAEVRENMTAYLCGNDRLPGLQQQDHQIIREAFDCLFDYHTYKGYLDIVEQQRRESLNILVFDHNQQYVAHIQFNSTTARTKASTFTVDATLTCQRFTHFELQKADWEVVLKDLVQKSNQLNVAEQPDRA